MLRRMSPLLAQSDRFAARLQTVAFKADIPPASRADRLGANDAVHGASSTASKCYRLVASKPSDLKEVRPGDDDSV